MKLIRRLRFTRAGSVILYDQSDDLIAKVQTGPMPPENPGRSINQQRPNTIPVSIGRGMAPNELFGRSADQIRSVEDPTLTDRVEIKKS